MCGSYLESMVQNIPEQEMLVVEEQELPQTDPEPEMGAAAAAVYDTSPPPLHQNPPILAESAQLSAPDIAQLFAMLAEMRGETWQMKEEINNKMDTNTNKMEKMRGEMWQMGQCLQAGKMATPRAGTSELGGSATAVRPAVEAGEDGLIRETCWARVVTEKVTVTVTERGKLIGVTETCTREIRHEVKGIGRERKEQLRRKARMRYTEIVKEQGVKQREGRERLKEKARLTYVKVMERRQKEAETNIHEERLHGTDGVRDAHTHTQR